MSKSNGKRIKKKFIFMPEFCVDCDNVYRTKHFIVKQKICLKRFDSNECLSISEDTFYERTPVNDLYYEKKFEKRHKIDGKRVKTYLSTRKYVFYHEYDDLTAYINSLDIE